MPFQQKSNRYQKRSHSSSQHHQHRRDRRTYEKDKTDRFDKYHRRSRSKTPPKEDHHKGKYGYNYQHKEERRYYDHYRDGDKGNQYEHAANKREQFEKRDREKGDQYAYKPKYNRYDNKESSRVRDRQSGYQKREKARNSPEHDRKRRKSSSSHSTPSSRKQTKRTQPKPSYNKYSSSDRYRQHERRGKRSMEKQEDGSRTKKIEEDKVKVSPQKEYKNEAIKPVYHDFPPPPPKAFVDRNSPNTIKRTDSNREQKSINKPLFKLNSFPPPPPSKSYRQEQTQREPPQRRLQRQALVIQPKLAKEKEEPVLPHKRVETQPKQKQQKPQSPLIKQKLSKFDQLLAEARHNLTISPPNSTFLMLQTFRTMNKFQVETLDPKWMNFLKKDMERYQEQKEAVMSKLAEPSKDEYQLTGQQYIWMKEQRNEQDLELKFRFQEFKLNNSNLSQMIRRLRFLD